jgi:hypothetical protein
MSNWGDGLDRRGFALSSIARPRFWSRSEYCESRGAGWRCPTCQPIGKEAGSLSERLIPAHRDLVELLVENEFCCLHAPPTISSFPSSSAIHRVAANWVQNERNGDGDGNADERAEYPAQERPEKTEKKRRRYAESVPGHSPRCSSPITNWAVVKQAKTTRAD